MKWRGKEVKAPVSKVEREHLILTSGPLKDGDSDSIQGGF